jgi:hypothetical protein
MNISNSELNISCESSHTNEDFYEFSYCYNYFFLKSILISVLTILLIISTIILNITVILLISKNQNSYFTVFDQILIGHAIVDGLTGCLDMPFYHIYSIFNYWPMSPFKAKLWASFDNSINTITNLHMIYLCYSRLRAVKCPSTYSTELILSQPSFVMASIWFIGFLIWIPVVLIFGLKEYSLELNDSLIVPIFEFIFWFIPLIIIFIISCMIFYELLIKNKITRQSNRHDDINKSLFEYIFNYYLGAEALFAIIMSVYWIQWIIPSVFNFVIYLTNIQTEKYSKIYWLTYSVCLTDAILLLLFNPNASILLGISKRNQKVIEEINMEQL